MPSDPIPGLISRSNTDGTLRYYWRASREGYEPKTVRLHAPEGGALDLENPAHYDFAALRCAQLQAEMLETLAGKAERPFDGTVAGLIRAYQTDPLSPWNRLKAKTRTDYQYDLDRLHKACGERRLDMIGAGDIWRWYEAAVRPKEPGGAERVRSAHGLMTMLRGLLSFGVVIELPHCARLSVIISKMKFKTPVARKVRPTFEQARAVYDKALEMGIFSIAMGTAMQFDGMLRQYDVSGQWNPLKPGEEAAIVLNGRRWSGPTWGDIGQDGVLRYETEKRGRYVEIDLKAYPFTWNALQAVPLEKRIGPLIIDERSGLPYAYQAYGKRWRQVADAAGIPRTILNRDLRAGGISEADDAGADIRHISKQAAHANLGFTDKRYARNMVEASRVVARPRVKLREKK